MNGIVLISYLNQLEKEGDLSLRDRILHGVQARFRPVIMTASVASLGFLPMALSTSAGAEVQRPLATVVIGGLITATLLTLVVLPVLYSLVKGGKKEGGKEKGSVPKYSPLFLLCGFVRFGVPTLLLCGSANAQRVVSLTEAVETAATQNLLIKSDQLGIQASRALLPASFNPPKTAVDGQYGQTQARPLDYTVTAIQSFSAPGLYRAQREALEGNVQSTQYQLAVTQVRLANEVKRTYYQLLFDQKLLNLLDEQSTLFGEAARAAEVRFRTGESNRLEAVTAQSRAQYLGQRIRNARREREVHYAALRLLLQSSDSLRIDTLVALKRPVNDSIAALVAVESNPQLDVLKQQITNARLQTRLEQKNFLPDWRLGFLNQSIERNLGYSALHVGVSFPLFTKALTAKVQASRIQQQIQETQFSYTVRQLATELEAARTRQQSLAATLDYYENAALPQAALIRQTALTAYTSGEIGYVEFFSAIQQAYLLQEEYLNSVLEYDLNLIRVEEILGIE